MISLQGIILAIFQLSQSLLWRIVLGFLLVVDGVDIVCFAGEVVSTKMNFSWKGKFLEFLFKSIRRFCEFRTLNKLHVL